MGQMKFFFLLIGIIGGVFAPPPLYLFWEEMSSKEKDSLLFADSSINKDAINFLQNKWKPSDDEKTFLFLDTITSLRRYPSKNRAFYFHVFNKICLKVDGSLAEVIGDYCLKILIEAPDYVIDYFSKDQQMMNLYTRNIGYKFLVEQEAKMSLYNFDSLAYYLNKIYFSDKNHKSTRSNFLREIKSSMNTME